MIRKISQKDDFNFKIYDVTAWLTIVIHILPTISRSKGKKTMKFGQLIECNKKHFY